MFLDSAVNTALPERPWASLNGTYNTELDRVTMWHTNTCRTTDNSAAVMMATAVVITFR